MFLLALHTYIKGILTHVPGAHWVFIGLMSIVLTLYLWGRKKGSVYSSIALGISVYIGLTLLDMAVLVRYLDPVPRTTGFEFSLRRIIHSTVHGRIELFSNIAAFIPFGLFLSEFLASVQRFSPGHRLGLATLSGFGMSLFIECLQLVLRVGFFELTDLMMNTVGTFIGAVVSTVGRRVLGICKNSS